MIALSIRQPWAHLIIHSGKDIENRSWYTNFRGRVLVHASKGMTRDEYEDAYDFVMAGIDCRILMPSREGLQRGGIVGSVEIVGCVTRSDSSWFMGRYGFVLRDPRPLPFYPCKGKLGFFQCDYPQEIFQDRGEERDPLPSLGQRSEPPEGPGRGGNKPLMRSRVSHAEALPDRKNDGNAFEGGAR